MPSRVIDHDALWQSDKLAALPAWAQPEYPWCYGLSDPNGVLELSNLRAVHHRVYAIRKTFPFSKFKRLIRLFEQVGLLFPWEENGKRFGYWTAAERRGRLPSPSTRGRYKPLGILPPAGKLQAYYQRFGIRQANVDFPVANESRVNHDEVATGKVGFGKGLDVEEGNAHTQEPTAPESVPVQSPRSEKSPESFQQHTLIPGSRLGPEDLATIWNDECGMLTHVRLPLTPKRQKRLAMLMRSPHFSFENFRLVVSRAKTAPFLRGEGKNGWRANLDWISDPDKFLQILEGQFDEHKTTVGDRVGRMVENLRGGHKAMQ